MILQVAGRLLGAALLLASSLPRSATAATLAVAPATAGAARPPEPPALPGLRLEAGSVARQPIVAVGRDVEVDGDALAGVTALDGSVAVSGRCTAT